MARQCELTGKRPQAGNHVSHANNKTRRRFLPNLVRVHLMSDLLNQKFPFRICVHALRSVEHRGGLDAFLLKADNKTLSPRALAVKKDVQRMRAQKDATAA